MLQAIEIEANSVGLMLNAEKTKYILSSRSEGSHINLPEVVRIGYELEVMKNLIYMGFEVTSDNETGSV